MQSAGSGQPSEAVQESGRQSPSAVMCLHNCEVTIGGSSTSRGINTGTADHSPHHWCTCTCTCGDQHFGDWCVCTYMYVHTCTQAVYTYMYMHVHNICMWEVELADCVITVDMAQ